MKKIYLITLFTLSAFSIKAQTADTVVSAKTKSTRIEINSGGVNIKIGKTDSTENAKDKTAKFPKVNFGFNFEHFDLGLSKYHTGSDFSIPAGYEFLEYDDWKTYNVGFDALQFGVRFNPNFKVMIAAGLDWNHIRLQRDSVTIKPDNPVLDYDSDPDANLKKNRFSSRYLRIPLYFEYRTAQLSSGKRLSLVAGPEVGFLIDGKVKQKTESGKKTKIRNDYNFEKFRYGVNARIGYGIAGLFFKYYFNDVFAKDEAPGLEDFKNLSFGLTFGF